MINNYFYYDYFDCLRGENIDVDVHSASRTSASIEGLLRAGEDDGAATRAAGEREGDGGGADSGGPRTA